MKITSAMRDAGMRAYWACERAIAPGLRFSQSHYEDALRHLVEDGSDWLDIGCGRRILPAWREGAERAIAARAGRLTGLDLDGASLLDNRTISNRVLGSGQQLPFSDAVFDLVTANMVMEHVEDPAAQLFEVYRVLRPGGRFLFHTPNERAYTRRLARAVPEWAKARAIRLLEGRGSSDVFPTHYRANTEEQIGQLAAAAGFEAERVDHITTSAQTAVILPLAVVELLWIRQLTKPRFAHYRHTIIATLRKPFASVRD